MPTLLVVEDEDTYAKLSRRCFAEQALRYSKLPMGSSAIDLLRANGGKIDLMLLDLTIPGASSREVVAEAAKAWPDIRVILTSAYGQEMISNAMSAPQIRSFIRKPFQLGDLVKTLRNTL